MRPEKRTPMERRIRRQRRRQTRSRPHSARPIIQLDIDIPHTKRHEPGQGLRRIRVRHTFDKLMHGADCVRPHVRAGVFEDHVEDEVEERFGEMDANLAAGVRHRIDQLHWVNEMSL